MHCFSWERCRIQCWKYEGCLLAASFRSRCISTHYKSGIQIAFCISTLNFAIGSNLFWYASSSNLHLTFWGGSGTGRVNWIVDFEWVLESLFTWVIFDLRFCSFSHISKTSARLSRRSLIFRKHHRHFQVKLVSCCPLSPVGGENGQKYHQK